NPTNDEVIREYEELTEQEIASVLQKSQTAFEQWRETDFSHRAPLMKKAAEVLRDHRQEYAELMAREMGKPVLGGRSEVEKCAWVCEYYAEHAESFLADQPIETDASNSFVAFQPLGVVLAVMPWNFPFWQVFRFAD